MDQVSVKFVKAQSLYAPYIFLTSACHKLTHTNSGVKHLATVLATRVKI